MVVRKEDLSLSVQPIADIVSRKGRFERTISDLIVRAVMRIDTAATDFLFARVGGPTGVQSFLERKGLTAATNDLGLLMPPGKASIAVAVFMADSPRPAKDRAAIIARVARAVAEANH